MMVSFSVGETIGTSFRVWFRNLIPFTILSVLIHAPVLIYTLVAMQDLEAAAASPVTGQIVRIIDTFLGVVLTASITYGVVMELRGQRASIGQNIGVGLGRFFPALGVSLLSYLIIGLVTGAFVLPGIALGSPWMTIVFGAVGFILSFLPFFVAVPASVLERPGVIGALKRSLELTSGKRAALFGMFVVLIIMFFVGSCIFGMAVGGAAVASGSTAAPKWPLYMGLAIGPLLSSFFSVLCAVTYYFLRSEREGIGADELARVFE